MIDPAFQPHIWDYVLVAFFALAMPLWMAAHTLPRIRALSPAQQEELRPRIYISAMISHWMMAAAALSPLFIGSASMTTLGLGFPLEFVPNLGLALALVFVVGLFIYMQRRRVMAMPDGRALVRDAIRRFDWILPRTRRQRTLWVFVSIHAGVCEEMFFRGFLLAMLNHTLPFWMAAIVASVLFGVGHMYQGVRGMIGTTVVGAIMIGLYVLSGSLWVSMLAHAVYDMHGGEFGRWALQDDEPGHTAA